MKQTTTASEGADALRTRVDAICTALLVGGAKSVSAAMLEGLAREAKKLGNAEAAERTRALKNALRAAQRDCSDPQSVLDEGLAQIRRALDGDAPQPVHENPGGNRAAAAEPALTALANDAELVHDFLVESREHLAKIESLALALERNPADLDVIHSVFRTFHTIKGLAGFLNFVALQEVSHETETLLDRARNREMAVTGEVIDMVLAAADYLRLDLQRIEGEAAGNTAAPPAPYAYLIERIHALIASGPPDDSPVEHNARNAVPAPAQEARITDAVPPAELPREADPRPAKEPPIPAPRSSESFTVRVDTVKLDRLLDMVGEMVIAQSLIRHNPALESAGDARLQADLAQLSRSTAEVQRTTMSMRMVPIGQVFQRTARLIRDLSRKAGKQVVLETQGEETEVDKTIAEELSDPLLHMVRNSMDHGIETPQERIAAGKDPMAHVRLSAYHQAGQIVVEIADDGRGLNREKIVAKAEQNGIVAPGAPLSDSEVWQLIFEPGFSTAEQVTDVSGRGVGMDVVRRNVQKLRGRIETRSETGRGATFTVRLPLTLAIIEGLVVAVGNSRYILPIFAVREIFRPLPEDLSSVQGRHEMAMVRGSLLPLVRLHRKFGIDARATDPCDGLLVVADAHGRRFCLLVDDLLGKQEVVIKSLGETFKDVPGLAGCAILGDGAIGLILEVESIYSGGQG